MNLQLCKVSLRQSALYIDTKAINNAENKISSFNFLRNINQLGFTCAPSLWEAIVCLNPSAQLQIFDLLKEVLGLKKNWTPFFKEWEEIETLFKYKENSFLFNFNFSAKKQIGITLSCGHFIPDDTFCLEKYNACPVCHTPFDVHEIKQIGQGSKLKILDLWNENDVNQFFVDLLQSKTALDATQKDSLLILISQLPLPAVEIKIKETVMLVMEHLIQLQQYDAAARYIKSPTDILRYLWYQKTGFLQIIEPKVIKRKLIKNQTYYTPNNPFNQITSLKNDNSLHLKYTRKECQMVATWLNNLEMSTPAICELMHPKRGMWVRFIRALRLSEYASRNGFEKLQAVMDCFYNQNYNTVNAIIQESRLKMDAEKAFSMLKKRPGLFARSLFANMLWFGPLETIVAFREVMDQVPARLLLTLNMYAAYYFNPTGNRSVKPLGGNSKRIPTNRLLHLYDSDSLQEMINMISELSLDAMKLRFSKIDNSHTTMFIDPMLYKMPLSIGDRSESIQDLPVALMGIRFPTEGNTVRLFMQWGTGLPAQHLDMDLSCQIAYDNKLEICSYSNLHATGCKHSGDIINIPHMIGTAEYIEMNLQTLQNAGAKYVTFTCNAFSNGAITPNLVVGWMNSAYPMKISKNSGVAYDPSCVQHQVRITQTLTKGLVFGVLDVENKEIVWLEMTFDGQVVQRLDAVGVRTMLSKLNSKFSIGALLALKATAQGLNIVEDATQADEIYDVNWAQNAASVTQLLID